MKRRTVWIMCMLVVVLGLLSVAYRLMQTPNFDLIKWQQADTASEYRDRRAMMPEVDRMLEQGTISSRASALHYLGRPQRGDLADGRSWFYSLGGSRSAESAPEADTWLVLIFDSAGNITHHKRIQEEPSRRRMGEREGREFGLEQFIAAANASSQGMFGDLCPRLRFCLIQNLKS